jgi:hypothetical protein
MRPITTEPNGGGCGSVVASRTLGAQERGRRPDTKVGLDGMHGDGTRVGL